jgi:ElaB/YqjD/DUF883 family membrane-anchored ribosome-binding protein
MMIVTAALPAASSSVEELLASEGGVPVDELRRLERRLVKARGLAADAEAKEGRDARARAWLRELRDALYELGDAVDDFRRVAARRQLAGRRSVSPPPPPPLRHVPFPLDPVGDCRENLKRVLASSDARNAGFRFQTSACYENVAMG